MGTKNDVGSLIEKEFGCGDNCTKAGVVRDSDIVLRATASWVHEDWNGIVFTRCTALHCTTFKSTSLYFILLYCTSFYSIVLHSTALHSPPCQEEHSNQREPRHSVLWGLPSQPIPARSAWLRSVPMRGSGFCYWNGRQRGRKRKTTSLVKKKASFVEW